MYAQRQMAQSAADAAAQAGIMSIFKGTNATSSNPFGTGTPPLLRRRAPRAMADPLCVCPEQRIRRHGVGYRHNELSGERSRRDFVLGNDSRVFRQRAANLQRD